VFAVVEQKEPHAGRMAFSAIEQPATFAARCELARRIRDELEVPLPIWVDGMDDASRALFSDLPSPAFVIDRDGRIADKMPWAEPRLLQDSIVRVLGKNASAPRQPPAATTAPGQRDRASVDAQQPVEQRKAGTQPATRSASNGLRCTHECAVQITDAREHADCSVNARPLTLVDPLDSLAAIAMVPHLRRTTMRFPKLDPCVRPGHGNPVTGPGGLVPPTR